MYIEHVDNKRTHIYTKKELSYEILIIKTKREGDNSNK